MENNHKKKGLKIYSVIITIIAVLLLAACVFIAFKSGFADKVMVRLGLKEEEYWTDTRKAVSSWDNTLNKLGYDADVVFFGDSLMMNSDFRQYFPQVRIVNLGYNGDTVTGMTERVSMISAVSPEKVFVFGGINVLRDSNLDQVLKDYRNLLEKIMDEVPGAEVYVQSILPVSKEVQDMYSIHTETIEAYNAGLRSLADEKHMTYIDVYRIYEKDGVMNMDYSEDGIHITPDSYSMWAEEIGIYIDTPEDANVGNIAGGEEDQDEDTGKYVALAWENSLRKMDIDADIVFFGDSLTHHSWFDQYFPDKEIVNLGCGGDTLTGISTRISMVQAVKPEKIFIMAGVNSLRDDNIKDCLKRYSVILDTLKEQNPDAEVYVQSILPMTAWMQEWLPCSRETTCKFNDRLKIMAEDKGMIYIDLFPLYEKDGEMNPALSFDGIHLNEPEGYDPWAEAIRQYIYD